MTLLMQVKFTKMRKQCQWRHKSKITWWRRKRKSARQARHDPSHQNHGANSELTSANGTDPGRVLTPAASPQKISSCRLQVQMGKKLDLPKGKIGGIPNPGERIGVGRYCLFQTVSSNDSSPFSQAPGHGCARDNKMQDSYERADWTRGEVGHNHPPYGYWYVLTVDVTLTD